MDRETRNDLIVDMQAAATAIFDAHDAHPDRRTRIPSEPVFALAYAKIVAQDHATHEGNWPIGSCDAQLFELEWLIYLYETLDKAANESRRTRIARKVEHLRKRLGSIGSTGSFG